MAQRLALTEPCSVYVMTCHSGQDTLAKVGISKNPRKRSFQVQNGCPLPLAGLYVCPVKTRAAALAAEWRAHSALARFRTKGEWFRIHSAQLEDFFAAVEGALAAVKAGPLERMPMMAHRNF